MKKRERSGVLRQTKKRNAKSPERTRGGGRRRRKRRRGRCHRAENKARNKKRERKAEITFLNRT